MSDRSATPSSEILSGASIGLLGGVGLAAVGTWSSPYVALAGLLSALGGIGVLLRPELGIYLTAFVIPLERLGRFTDDTAAVPISLMRIVGTGAFAVYALQRLQGGLPLNPAGMGPVSPDSALIPPSALSPTPTGKLTPVSRP